MSLPSWRVKSGANSSSWPKCWLLQCQRHSLIPKVVISLGLLSPRKSFGHLSWPSQHCNPNSFRSYHQDSACSSFFKCSPHPDSTPVLEPGQDQTAICVLSAVSQCIAKMLVLVVWLPGPPKPYAQIICRTIDQAWQHFLSAMMLQYIVTSLHCYCRCPQGGEGLFYVSKYLVKQVFLYFEVLLSKMYLVTKLENVWNDEIHIWDVALWTTSRLFVQVYLDFFLL